MKKFWPDRLKPNGFSIEKMAINYRERLNNSSYANKEGRNSNNNFSKVTSTEKSTALGKYNYNVTDLSISHWANRDFGEYRHIA